MSKGSYRGGSTTVGWNANRYALTGRTRKGKALIQDLAVRTAESRAAAADQDARARKLHGLAPPKGVAGAAPQGATSAGKSGLAEAIRKRRKAAGRQAFTVTVVRRRKG